MPQFSPVSQQRLRTCDDKLQRVFNEVVKHFDCTILEGFRDKKAQELAYATGKSKNKWPDGKHNKTPSLAVDVIPYSIAGIDWNDSKRICYFAGYVMATAANMGISLRWGGDWDMDTELKDNNFNDLVHFELR